MSVERSLSGWGRHQFFKCLVDTLDPNFMPQENCPSISRGCGRAYGDAAINPTLTLDGTRLNRFISFDPQSGKLVAEAGVTLAEVIDVALPQGWFIAVTPGTQFVTLAGAFAADVHGKNHHLDGSFADHVEYIDIIVADGSIIRASKHHERELFNFSAGAMGLTGHILTVALQLKRVSSAYIKQKNYCAAHIDEALSLFEQNLNSPYSVAWFDCLASQDALGRSIVMTGAHLSSAELSEKRRENAFQVYPKRYFTLGFDAPRFLLNSTTMRCFNQLYYRLNKSKQSSDQTVDYQSFFYPLDGIYGWNRLYGKKGFMQYQCVVPLGDAATVLKELLQEISRSGLGSFLAVLKRMGKGAPERALSFPIEGYTLALDFKSSAGLPALFQRLDSIVVAAQGRHYLAKDAHLSPEHFKATYQDAAERFCAWRKETGADKVFQSALSERLGL